jgi:hypothetical protein
MTRENAIAEVSLYSQANTYPTVDTTTLGTIVDKWKRYSTWTPSTVYAVGDRVVPPIPNGRVYECMQAGTSGTDTTLFPSLWGQYEGRVVYDGNSQPQLLWRDFGPTSPDMYDTKSATRAVWLLKAGMVATEIDSKEGQSDVKLSSLQAQCLMMAERYRPMGIF